VPLSEHLKDYIHDFSGDIEQLWANRDVDGNGILDRQEAYQYILSLSKLLKDR